MPEKYPALFTKATNMSVPGKKSMKPIRLFALFAAVAFLAPGIARADDLSGTWKFESIGPKGGSSTMNCKLTQSASDISGPCVTPQGSTVDVSGTVTGNQVDIGYNLAGGPLHVDFKGLVQSDGSMKGTVTVTVTIPPAPFTGIKQ